MRQWFPSWLILLVILSWFLEINHLERCLKKCSSLYKLIQLNPLDKNTRKPPESIDVGFEAKQKPSTKELRVQKRSQGIPSAPSQLSIWKIPSEVCHHSQCTSQVNPLYLGNLLKRNYYQNHVGIILQKLVSIGRISGKSAEVVKEGYFKFFDIVDQNLQLFSSFNLLQDRVDTLFSTTLGSSKLLHKPLRLCENVFDSVSWSIHNRKRLQHQQAIACWKSEVEVFGCS